MTIRKENIKHNYNIPFDKKINESLVLLSFDITAFTLATYQCSNLLQLL